MDTLNHIDRFPDSPFNGAGRDPRSGRFLPGHQTAVGRANSKNRLSHQFLSDLHALWEQRGNQLLEQIISEPGGPLALVKIVASIIPKELIVQDEGARFVINALPRELTSDEWLEAHGLKESVDNSQD